MRISETAPHLTAAAQASFQNTHISKHHSFDDVIPASSALRFFVDRGQKFGLFSEIVSIELGVLDRSWSHHYHAATIQMAMPQGSDIKGKQPYIFSIYKDIHSGLYHTGKRRGKYVQVNSDGMDEEAVGHKMLEWSRAFCDENISKRSAFLNTFSEKPVPDAGAALRASKASFFKVLDYIRG